MIYHCQAGELQYYTQNTKTVMLESKIFVTDYRSLIQFSIGAPHAADLSPSLFGIPNHTTSPTRNG